MVCDITDFFISGTELWREKEIEHFIDKMHKILKSCVFRWDESAGEDWMLIYYEAELVGMLHARIKNMFILKRIYKKNYNEMLILETNTSINVMCFDDFECPKWKIDLDIISKYCPLLCWHAVREAVNPNKFSLYDLYYASV